MKKGEKRPDLYKAAVRTCPICNKEFRAVKDTKTYQQKYCSPECYRKKRANPVIEMKCKYCGAPFMHRKGSKSYCSHECYAEHLKTLEKGENSHFWKGGKTKESKLRRTCVEYKNWRLAVFTRDGFKCTECGSRKRLEAHHIKEQSRYPELIYSVENGLSLCHECHKKTDNYGRHSRIYKKRENKQEAK